MSTVRSSEVGRVDSWEVTVKVPFGPFRLETPLSLLNEFSGGTRRGRSDSVSVPPRSCGKDNHGNGVG